MKKILLMVVLFYSCSSKRQNNFVASICEGIHLKQYLLSLRYNASISLPSQWTIVDSSRFGINKNLVASRTIFSKDSNSRAFILVEDFKVTTELEKDTNSIKNYLKTEIENIKNNKDSILSVKLKNINGWTTAFQKSFIKSSKNVVVGQVFSANRGNRISILVQIMSESFESSNQLLDCIIASFSVMNNSSYK